MAAITFPTSPTNGQIYTAPNGFSYTWDSALSIWMASSAGGSGPTTGVITGTAAQDYQKKATTPTTRADGTSALVEGDFWYDSANDSLKVYDGAAWDAPGSTTGIITGTAAQDYQVAATAPTTRSVAAGSGALVEGDQWYDTANDLLKVRSGAGTWLTSDGGGAAAPAVSATLTSLYSGSFGNGWYDLGQHGPGLYRIGYALPGLSTNYIVVYYDGIATGAQYSTFTTSGLGITLAGPLTGITKYSSGALPARYLGSRSTSLSTTMVLLTPSGSAYSSLDGDSTIIVSVQRITQ